MKKKILSAAFAALLALPTWACTNMIVGKNASTDGSVIVSYAADSYGMFGELAHFKAGTHADGEMVDIYEWDTGRYLGKIAQAKQTYNVIGNINEYQLTIAETTWGGRPELQDTTAIIDYGSLIYLALQRSRTAREAIKVMTSLVQEYGYYSEGETFTIADPNEVWMMDMIGKGPGIRGAVWVAVRIPDDCVACHANQSRIRQFSLNDKENCLYAPDVITLAREKGYFSGVNKDFSFADAYCPLNFGGLRYCEARVWSFYNMFADDAASYLDYAKGDASAKPMPLYWKPNRKVSVRDIQQAMRDHYEGPPLDISQDFGAGPYKAPYRLTPLSFKVDGESYFNERPISTQQTSWVFVSQMRAQLPDAVGGVLWFGMDDANLTVFTPMYCCMTEAPLCYTHPDGADICTFSWNSSFWVFNWVSNMAYQRYSLLIDDIRQTQQGLEETLALAQEGIESTALKLLQSDAAKGKAFLTNYSVQSAQHTLNAWKKLGEYLIVKYNDGTIRPTENGKFKRGANGMQLNPIRVGYPEEFLKEYIKQTGERYKMPK